MKGNMNKKSAILAVMIAAITVCSPLAWSAGIESDAATVKRQASSIAELKALVVTVGDYKTADVELKATAHQITITVINSKLAKTNTADREDEATRIVSSIARSIKAKPAFSQVPVIHVDYVTQARNKRKTVQRIDFFQTPAGTFVLHKT